MHQTKQAIRLIEETDFTKIMLPDVGIKKHLKNNTIVTYGEKKQALLRFETQVNNNGKMVI